jgi:hypothetical protein
MILNKPMPYHPLGLPQPGCTPADAAALGIDLDVRPSLAEVLEVRGTRMTMVRGIVDGLTDDDLERVCPRLPAPGYPEEARSVGLCLGVVMKEECEHRRYAVRDLAALEADNSGHLSWGVCRENRVEVPTIVFAVARRAGYPQG